VGKVYQFPIEIVIKSDNKKSSKWKKSHKRNTSFVFYFNYLKMLQSFFKYLMNKLSMFILDILRLFNKMHEGDTFLVILLNFRDSNNHKLNRIIRVNESRFSAECNWDLKKKPLDEPGPNASLSRRIHFCFSILSLRTRIEIKPHKMRTLSKR